MQVFKHFRSADKRRGPPSLFPLLLLAQALAGTSAWSQPSVWDTYEPSAEPQVPATSQAGAAATIQSGDDIYTALLTFVQEDPGIPDAAAQQLTEAERGTQMVGRIAVPLGEVFEKKGEENTQGYQVYANYAAAQRAFGSMSVATDLGIATATEGYESIETFKAKKLVMECERFANPRFSNFPSSVRCAALHSDHPVIVTGLKTDVSVEPDAEDFGTILEDDDAQVFVRAGLLFVDKAVVKIKNRRTLDQPQVEMDTRSPPPRSSTGPGGFLGVGVRDLDQKSADALGLADISGAAVVTVAPGSPAESAGLKLGDVLVSFNGASIRDANDLVARVGRSPIGAEAALEIFRKGPDAKTERLRLIATVSERRDTSGETRQPQTKPSKGGLEEFFDRFLRNAPQ